ncbi:uncharacterized protein LOC117579271 [Drosophila guanche]|uniref:Protein TsetseEP domain-containing protein n=1 Tax=Drosophila guanche TaxID=7266 RepID=A0A3B0J4B2_DROGU|nr:uncharacterized protein LOC117579271 [Drosophila guanche]SPP74242.1 Hypothetical predicted protein [Drosophila guanche]
MQSFLIATAISLVIVGLAGAQSSTVANSLDDYIDQNQRQYEAQIRKYEEALANFRTLFSKRQQVIDVQADLLQQKLEEAFVRINPLSLIDPWHKQCVQNYSSSIPTIATVRSRVASCQATISTALNSADSVYNTLKKYYNTNLKNSLADCVKKFPSAQLNYTVCVTKVIADANAYSISSQNSFNTHVKDADCTVDSRLRSAWTCSFGQVYSTSAAIENALRLIDNCIDNQLVCGSVSCSSGCPNVSTINLTEADFRNETIRNPFRGLSAQAGCREFRFK